MRRKNLMLAILMLLPVVFGLGGCTHTYKISDEASMTYPDTTRHNLRVELRLSDEFTSYEWKMSRMGDTFKMPLGDALSNNAEAMSRELFVHVDVIREYDNSTRFEISSTRDADAVLTPSVSVVERPMGTWAFDKMTTTIGVEWALTDRKGALIWLQTIDGVGEANTGNIFTHHGNAEKQAQAAIVDLFSKTFEAMSTAPEIIAVRRRTP
jgi:hypothetical protein